MTYTTAPQPAPNKSWPFRVLGEVAGSVAMKKGAQHHTAGEQVEFRISVVLGVQDMKRGGEQRDAGKHRDGYIPAYSSICPQKKPTKKQQQGGSFPETAAYKTQR